MSNYNFGRLAMVTGVTELRGTKTVTGVTELRGPTTVTPTTPSSPIIVVSAAAEESESLRFANALRESFCTCHFID